MDYWKRWCRRSTLDIIRNINKRGIHVDIIETIDVKTGYND